MAQSPVSLQDVFATVPDPMQVQQELVKRMQEQLAQMSTQEEKFGFNIGNAVQRLGQRFRTGEKGDGVLHRLRTGDPAHPQVAQAERTQEAVSRATSVTGDQADGETTQQHELRLLQNLRRELNDKTNPKTLQAVTARIAALSEEEYQRSRLEESDQRARDEEARRAKAATLDQQLAQLRINQLEKFEQYGAKEHVVIRLPDGTEIDRREDSPEIDQLVRAGAEVWGTRLQMQQAELARELATLKGEPKLARLTNAQIDSLGSIQTAVNDASAALELLNKGTFTTGMLTNVGGLRASAARNGLLSVVGADNPDFEEFVRLSDRMRLTFQELAKGNPSNMENELFIKANFDPNKSIEYNIGIAELVHEQMAARLQLEVSAAMQNNQAVPPEAIAMLRELGVNPSSVNAGMTMAQYEADAQQRLEALAELEGRVERAGAAEAAQAGELTPEQQAAIDRLLAE